MSKRFDNKKLIYLIAGLIVLLILTILIRIPKEEATLKSKITDFDTLEAGKIVIYPKYLKETPIEFNRTNGKWTVQHGSVISAPQKGAIENIFNEILSIKPQSLAAINKSKWKEFELTDSLATRIKVLNTKGKVLADLMVGKFSYKQVNNPYSRNVGNSVEGTSYVRLSGEKEVYGVEGFISFFFSGKFNDWRDKSFMSLNKNDITNIIFTYPADSSFKLIKNDNRWNIGTFSADSANVSNYLITLSSMDGQDIKDNYKPAVTPACQVLIQGNNQLNISVKCYNENSGDEYIMNSSLNPDVYFTSKKDGLFGRLFKPRNSFIKKKS
jgi:hypothetical protein